MDAEVFVQVSIGEYEEEPFSCGSRHSAAWAKQE